MEMEARYRILEGISNCVPENGSGEDEENLLQNFQNNDPPVHETPGLL